ncbi:MAG: magnesium protoporphyrin IX methyltransferase, partial [Polynucleobacter sp.]
FDAWAKLTSTAPVSGIRKTVRAGRDEMRKVLLSYLPADLHGQRVLDAGCGTGALAVELAKRGAQVMATDISPTLIDLARERLPTDLGRGSIEFFAGDMLDPSLGNFDHVVCMDSMIHYHRRDITKALAGLAQRTSQRIAFTFAPKNPFLSTMITVGRLFPRGDRAPFIEPVAEQTLAKMIAQESDLSTWKIDATQKIARGFYISQAMVLTR